MKLLKAIANATKYNQLDMAIECIQTALGQKEGDNAGLYFADTEEPDTVWSNATEADRTRIMCDYAISEINQIKPRQQ